MVMITEMPITVAMPEIIDIRRTLLDFTACAVRISSGIFCLTALSELFRPVWRMMR